MPPLTPEDIKEFQKLYREEFDEELPLGEAANRARQLLKLYWVLAQSYKTELTEKETGALQFIEKHLSVGQSPSIREIARALEYKSSRSGFRIVQQLTRNGHLKRNRDGTLTLM